MTVTRLTLPAPELAAALDAVRFAVGRDTALPAVAGVLLELEADALRLVATDRYRLAGSQAAMTALAGPPVSVIAPTAFVDEVRALLDGTEGRAEAELLVDGDRLTATVGGRTVTGERIDQDYPDYRRMLRLEPTHQVPVDANELRRSLGAGATRSMVRGQDGAECTVSVLTVDAEGTLRVAGEEPADGPQVAVNREFLLEALTAGRQDQLVLELGGPVAPLAVRFPDREDTFSLLMPTALN